MTNSILIVDDNILNIELLTSVLYAESYDIFTASDGLRAVEIATDKLPDLILLDVMMPDMNGYEVCQRLKEQNTTKDIPIVFLTARSEEYAIVEGFEVGGVDYITKPFNHSELLLRVATHLKIKNQKTLILQQQNELLKKNVRLEKINKELNLSNEKILKNTELIVEKENKFRSIFNNITDIFYRTTLDGKILLLSPSAKKIFGEGSFIDNEINLNDKKTFFDTKTRRKLLDKLFKNGKVNNYLLKLQTFDGNEIFVEANSYLIFNEKTNQPVAIEGILRDVTEKQYYKQILEDNEKRLNSIFENVQSGIVVIDAETLYIVDANPAAKKLIGDVENYSKLNSCKILCSLKAIDDSCPILKNGKKINNYECNIIDIHHKKIPIVKSVTEFFLKDKRYFLETFVDISQQKEMQKQLEIQNKKIEEQHNEIISSINYAFKIQDALLPSEDFLKNFMPENFIIYKPKDIISGDFYWTKQINNTLFIAVADCTGHGVPGAFISTIAITLLNEIVGRRFILETDEILNELRKQVILLLHQDYMRKKTIHDGLDISLCSINLFNFEMSFSGANNSLVHIAKNLNTDKFELQQIKADKMPISSYVRLDPFSKNKIILKENDKIYLFTDGYADQIGERRQKKFYKKRLLNLFLEINEYPMKEQKEVLENIFYKRKGNFMQIDDITIIGIKISTNLGKVDLF